MGRAGPLVRGEGSHDGCELCGKPRLCGGGHGEVQGCAAFTGSRDARGGQKADRRKRLARRQRGRVAARGERINRDWQYDGLSTPQKDAIDPGQHPSLWTAPALGLKMATRLRLLLDILNAPEAGIRSQWSFHETDHVLMSTAGAGGTTIATSLVFKNVSAGDFCPAQLLALRHNIHTVMRLDGVSVDQTPMNLMSRPDFSRYSAIVIEPLWGGLKFSEAPEGALELFVPTGAYNEETVDDVALGVPGWRVQEGARPLAGVVAEIMSTHVGLKGAAILVPNNFNIKGFADTINGKGLMLFVVRTVGLPPADLTETSLKRMAKLSRPITVDDMRSLRHFNRYHGPDRFVLVLRKSSFFRTEGEPLGISSKERRALARRDNVDDFEGGLVIDDYDVRVHSKGRADFRQRMLSRYRGWDQAFNGSVGR